MFVVVVAVVVRFVVYLIILHFYEEKEHVAEF